MRRILYFLIFLIFKKCHISASEYFELPRFWTNTGFCPLGNHSDYLLSKDVEINIRLIAAIPNYGLERVRIHWLLDLISLSELSEKNKPIYDFTKLDGLMDSLNDAGLSVGFEVMGNPSEIFQNNLGDDMWDDLIFQITRRYINRFGPFKMQKWRFESWNEPDLHTYNTLNFTFPEYLRYLDSLKFGIRAGSRNNLNSTHLKISGPGGLFKNKSVHPFCWGILKICNENRNKCPFDILTYHRKGKFGGASEIIDNSQALLFELFAEYPNLRNMKIANNEADPVAGWSTPRDFQTDVRYAVKVVNTVFQHWNAKLRGNEFKSLVEISHDNAFLSYHPHEFSQRTLFARFQMNESSPVYSEFILKPVYVALGMLSNLGPYAQNVEEEYIPGNQVKLKILKTVGSLNENQSSFQSWVVIGTRNTDNSTVDLKLSISNPYKKRYAVLLETLESHFTDPAKVWTKYGKPAYPTRKFIELLRKFEYPRMCQHAESKNVSIEVRCKVETPFVSLMRLCEWSDELPAAPFDLRILSIHLAEVLLTWKEPFTGQRCVKGYEIWFKSENTDWKLVSKRLAVPFLSFFFYPNDGIVHGAYKVRAIDIFERGSRFSKTVNFSVNIT